MRVKKPVQMFRSRLQPGMDNLFFLKIPFTNMQLFSIFDTLPGKAKTFSAALFLMTRNNVG